MALTCLKITFNSYVIIFELWCCLSICLCHYCYKIY